jgi:hypothetical protein
MACYCMLFGSGRNDCSSDCHGAPEYVYLNDSDALQSNPAEGSDKLHSDFRMFLHNLGTSRQ